MKDVTENPQATPVANLGWTPAEFSESLENLFLEGLVRIVPQENGDFAIVLTPSGMEVMGLKAGDMA